MINEGVFILSAIVNLGFVLLAFRIGKAALIATIVVNLILISTFGAELVPFFGLVTNAGNVFYSAIFLAVNMLVEHFGKKQGYKAILIGFFSLLLFIIMSQFVVYSVGVSDPQQVDQAIATLFNVAPRIAFASTIGYLIAQSLNVKLYDFLKVRTEGRKLWFRNIVSTSLAQIIDSILFFTIAFAGVIPPMILFQTIIAGFGLKVFIALLSTPFLYVSYTIKANREGTSTLDTLRD